MTIPPWVSATGEEFGSPSAMRLVSKFQVLMTSVDVEVTLVPLGDLPVAVTVLVIEPLVTSVFVVM
jgi:hypothetical protein